MTLYICRDVRIDSAGAEYSAGAEFCAESATLRRIWEWILHRIEENLPNGSENAKILLIFVNPFS